MHNGSARRNWWCCWMKCWKRSWCLARACWCCIVARSNAFLAATERVTAATKMRMFAAVALVLIRTAALWAAFIGCGWMALGGVTGLRRALATRSAREAPIFSCKTMFWMNCVRWRYAFAARCLAASLSSWSLWSYPSHLKLCAHGLVVLFADLRRPCWVFLSSTSMSSSCCMRWVRRRVLWISPSRTSIAVGGAEISVTPCLSRASNLLGVGVKTRSMNKFEWWVR